MFQRYCPHMLLGLLGGHQETEKRSQENQEKERGMSLLGAPNAKILAIKRPHAWEALQRNKKKLLQTKTIQKNDSNKESKQKSKATNDPTK
ncbi:Small G protein signaling modulator 3 [Bienertia sinuspersici]